MLVIEFAIAHLRAYREKNINLGNRLPDQTKCNGEDAYLDTFCMMEHKVPLAQQICSLRLKRQYSGWDSCLVSSRPRFFLKP